MTDQDTQYQEFTDDAEVEAAAEAAAAELDEVDTPDEETDEPSEPAKVVKKKKLTSTRPPVPEGFITPVAWAKELSARLTAEGRANGSLEDDEEYELPPQMVYSWLNAAKKEGAKFPLPSHSSGGRENLLVRDEANAWWEAKEARKAARAAGGNKKKVKTVTEATEPDGEVEEAE